MSVAASFMIAAPLAHDLDRIRDFGETDVIETEKRKTQTGVDQGESAGAVIGGD
jgi:hypothetical protein